MRPQPNPYARLPAAAQGKVRSAVWDLSLDSAGLFLQFATSAPEMRITVTLRSSSLYMWHFPSTGASGVDLYGWDAGNSSWRWMATPHPAFPTYTLDLPAGCASGRYRLHLPTYNAPTAVQVSVPAGHTASSDPAMGEQLAPIVWYGTSILQGGVASRPGQAFTHHIFRELNDRHQVMNFGFSGNGKMELNVTEFLIRIPAAAFIVDCMWNMDEALVASSTVPLVKLVRSVSSVPIVLVEGTRWGVSWYSAARLQEQAAKRAALRTAYESLVAAGVENLHYVYGDDLYNSTLPVTVDPTVGGVHREFFLSGVALCCVVLCCVVLC